METLINRILYPFLVFSLAVVLSLAAPVTAAACGSGGGGGGGGGGGSSSGGGNGGGGQGTFGDGNVGSQMSFQTPSSSQFGRPPGNPWSPGNTPQPSPDEVRRILESVGMTPDDPSIKDFNNRLRQAEMDKRRQQISQDMFTQQGIRDGAALEGALMQGYEGISRGLAHIGKACQWGLALVSGIGVPAAVTISVGRGAADTYANNMMNNANDSIVGGGIKSGAIDLVTSPLPPVIGTPLSEGLGMVTMDNMMGTPTRDNRPSGHAIVQMQSDPITGRPLGPSIQRY